MKKVFLTWAIIAITLGLSARVSLNIANDAASGNALNYNMVDDANNTKLGNASGPNCSSGCTQTITSSNSNISLNSGDVICVTGSNITVGFNANGGTVRICGSNVSVNNANFNNGATLIVTSTASVSFNSLNINSSWNTSSSFQNHGTITINNGFSPNGNVWNEGTITINGNFNVNNPIVATNNATINVSQSMNVNGTLTNNGQITTNLDTKVNGGATFTNNCILWAKNEYHNNGITQNYDLIKVDKESKINGGSEMGMHNAAMFSTNDISIMGTIKGYGSTSLVKVLRITSINNGAQVINAIQFCDVNGIETNNGSIGSGATIGCSLYIPITSCNTLGNGTPPITDTDNDGVADADDDYPNDATRAFNSYFPANNFGTLGFEDTWPGRGDYDMNDLVVSYRFNTVTNANNKIVEVKATLIAKAAGASFNNGFGFQFANTNVSQSDLTCTGSQITRNGATLGSNGLETNQNKPTFIVFDDVFDHLIKQGTVTGVNTTKGGPSVPADTFNLVISFSNTNYTAAQLDIQNFNPFLIVNRERGKEVHLANYLPTSKADNSYFKTSADASNASTGVFYKTASGLPWAINVLAEFAWPTERTDLVKAYNYFQNWAESAGANYADWYKNLSGYRNTNLIY
jgi:LruC domain-containing protein